MKLTLMIEGSPAVIAAVLAALPGGATVVTDQQELPLDPAPAPQTAVTATEPVGSTAIPTSDPVDAGAPQVDSAGVPWDARIHASSKATVSAGTWRMKRGVDQATVDAVLAELTGQNQAVSPMPIPMPVMPVEPMPMPVTDMPAVGIVPEPAAIPMPVAEPGTVNTLLTPQPEPAATGAAITIPEFMQKLSAQMTGPDAKITNEYLAEVVGKFNAAYGTTFVTVNDFFTAPHQLPALVQMITLDGKW